MNKITPEYISQYISFKQKDESNSDENWTYNRKGINDIYKIQAEGSAKLWNILHDEHTALLADEVGMGKTYQALAIIITLWLQKPDAKVLLYAPNENVAKKWIREYENFVRYHYRYSDDQIKSSINGEPMRKAIYCENQLELLKFIKLRWPAFFICKTSSLSNFLSKKITQDEIDNLKINITKIPEDEKDELKKSKWMYSFAKKCNDFIYEKLSTEDNPPFDLLVFDEAHYLRNAHADTNRSLVAHAFFAKRDVNQYDNKENPLQFLTKKTLLLTATPNHTSSQNVQSIVSIFYNRLHKVKPDEILRRICVRRFRRLNGKTKHQYREEKPIPVEIKNIKEKLFFAYYQRSLVKLKAAEHAKQKDIKNKLNPYRLLFGYLEGFEFLPNKNTEVIKTNSEQGKTSDFSSREDAKVILRLSETYKKFYKHYPLHPKYVKITNNLSPKDKTNHPSVPPKKEDNLLIEKSLVFVRRIASVKELSRRVIQEYDEQFKTILHESNDPNVQEAIKINDETRLRRKFANLSYEIDDQEDDALNANVTENYDDNDSYRIPSKFLSLFTIRKDNIKSTDCSNFRNRFLRDFTMYSIFMHPALDYDESPYVFSKYIYQDNKRNYAKTAQALRLDRLPQNKKEFLNSQFKSPKLDPNTNFSRTSFHTIFSLWHKVVRQSNDEFLTGSLQTYQSFSEIEKEAFSNYLGKGILFASGYIIWFYSLFKSNPNHHNISEAEKVYQDFCKKVENGMINNGLAKLIALSVNSFQIFYKKELGLTQEKLLTENWNFLNNSYPVYPIAAESKRDSTLKAFNTPFYPNVLVATSVLQEGVDLHYHCNEVIHYGLAWTQGDNEQRVGRVDRLNGKMESQLKASSKATLPIHYPYLQNTIDEDQTARFILRKKDAEKLIDQFVPLEQSHEINYSERIEKGVWEKGFNKPTEESYESKDPYPVQYEKDFKGLNPKMLKIKDSNIGMSILDPILTALAKHFKDEFYVYDPKIQYADNRVFAIKHQRSNGRDQPIIAEFNYYEPGLRILSKPVYYLRIKTPIYQRGVKLDDIEFEDELAIYLNDPTLKLCRNKSSKDHFKYLVCSDLPLFKVESDQINLSENEIILAIKHIIEFSDNLEQKLTKNDIKNDKIIENNLPVWIKTTTVLSEDRKIQTFIDPEWKTKSEYLYRQENHRKNIETFHEMYEYNFEKPFIKHFTKNGTDRYCVGLYKNDALKEEIELYKDIFENEQN